MNTRSITANRYMPMGPCEAASYISNAKPALNGTMKLVFQYILLMALHDCPPMKCHIGANNENSITSKIIAAPMSAGMVS
jgi:hypothetical protein